MLLYELTIITCVALAIVTAHENITGDEILCEPKELDKTATHFAKSYGLETGMFIIKTVYFSNLTFPDATPGTGDLLSSDVAHSFRLFLNIKKTKHFEPMRRSVGMTFFFNFYYGDTVTCHIFHPITGEYKVEKIGFHTLKYYCVIPSGHYVGLDFEKHQGEKFAFVSVIAVRSKHSNGNLDTFTRDEMIERFPQHEKIIARYYGE